MLWFRVLVSYICSICLLFLCIIRLWVPVQIQPSHWKCQILPLENVCRQSRNCHRQFQRQFHLPYLSKGVPKVLKTSLETAAPAPVQENPRPATPRSWSRCPRNPQIIIKNTPGEVVSQHSVKRPPMLDETADVQDKWNWWNHRWAHLMTIWFQCKN